MRDRTIAASFRTSRPINCSISDKDEREGNDAILVEGGTGI